MKLLTLSSIASWPSASALKKVCRDGIARAISCKLTYTTDIHKHALETYLTDSPVLHFPNNKNSKKLEMRGKA